MCYGFNFMKNDDIKYMKIALKEANKAFLKNEVPVGAVLVINDKIIAKGYNQTILKCDPSAHAEFNIIKKACKKIGNYRLCDATLYVSVEPCAMCAGLINWARIKRVVFGTFDYKSGAYGGSFNINDVKSLNHKPIIESGILDDECRSLMQTFFKNKRKIKQLINN